MDKNSDNIMNILEPQVVNVDPKELAEALRPQRRHTEPMSIDVDGSPMQFSEDALLGGWKAGTNIFGEPSKDATLLPIEEADRTFLGYWAHKFDSKITSAGKKVVCIDPNLEKSTIASLLESEAALIGEDELKRIQETPKQQLAAEEFYENNATGIAHLSICIRDRVDSCLAELVDSYSDDRGIPFALGAVYILALMQTEGLRYIQFYPERGYYSIHWSPVAVNVIPKAALPPHIRKRIAEPNFEDKTEEPYHLKACPICGGEARMLRTGRANSKWHVCCGNDSCFLSFGIPHHECSVEHEAARVWNSIVLSERYIA